MARLTSVDLGTIITMDDDRMPQGEQTYEVLPACDSKNGGHWYCVTHDEHFGNQFQKDLHISEMGQGKNKKHVLAWMCHEHGPEVP